MSNIIIRPFGGMIPRRGDKHLPPHAASDAENCLLLSGELRPLHLPSLLAEFYPPLTHQEATDRFGPLPPIWADYEGILDDLQTRYNKSLIIWVKGPDGIVNAGIGETYAWDSGAYDWGGAPLISDGFLSFRTGIVQALRNRAEGDSWFISLTGAAADPDYQQTASSIDGVTTLYEPANNNIVFTTTANAQSGNGALIDPGTPMRAVVTCDAVYQDNGCGQPTAPVPTITFTISDGAPPGNTGLLNETIFAGSGTRQIDAVYEKGTCFLLCEPQAAFCFTFPDPPPDTFAQVTFSSLYERITRGAMGLTDMAVDKDCTFSVFIKYNKDVAFGQRSNRQYVVASGQWSISIDRDGFLRVLVSTSPIEQIPLGRKISPTGSVVSVTRTKVQGSILGNTAVYIDGEFMVELPTGPWEHVGTPRIVLGRAGDSDLTTSQFPLSSDIAQLYYVDQRYTEYEFQKLAGLPAAAEYEDSFDTYVRAITGLQVWLQGVDGAARNAAPGPPTGKNILNARCWTVGRGGVFSASPLTSAGACFDPSGGSAGVKLVKANKDAWVFGVGDGLSTLAAPAENQTTLLAHALRSTSFWATLPNDVRPFWSYVYTLTALEVISDAPAPPTGLDPVAVVELLAYPGGIATVQNTVRGSLYGDIYPAAPQSVSGTYVCTANNTRLDLYVKTLNAHNGGGGELAETTHQWDITGHGGGMWTWTLRALPYGSDYTLHVLLDYQDTFLGIAAPAIQVIVGGGFRTSDGAAGIVWFLDNGVITIRHGAGDIHALGPALTVGAHQIVVTYKISTTTLTAYVDGVLHGTASSGNSGVLSSFEGLGYGWVNGYTLTHSSTNFPLCGKFQHLFTTNNVKTPAEIADLYTQWQGVA